MKKYISLALIWSFCLLAFSACESYLEEMPQNKLMPTTTDDYDQLLNNAYHRAGDALFGYSIG